MKPDERIKAARLGYLRAVAAARAAPTAANWTRLRAAAKALNDASRHREQGARGSPQPPPEKSA